MKAKNHDEAIVLGKYEEILLEQSSSRATKSMTKTKGHGMWKKQKEKMLTSLRYGQFQLNLGARQSEAV